MDYYHHRFLQALGQHSPLLQQRTHNGLLVID